MTIDWTKLQDYKEVSERTILTATFALTKNAVIDSLKSNYVFVDGHYYRTPKNDLLDLLRDDVLSDSPICVELELEKKEL
jgi:prepilin-type processing-associated H-X9-DG protein